MTSRSKILLALAAAAAIMSGCATGPYYDSYNNGYAYNDGYSTPGYSTPGYSAPGYYYDGPTYYYGPPAYYYPRYYGPSIGFGFSYGRRWH
jgi:hypothetical protein